MIGLIVTGHAQFASGLTSSLKLIAGEQEYYVPVDFDEETAKLEQDLQNALQQLSGCEGILILSDLPGGSPFKTAVMVSVAMPNVKVIAGTNLPMLVEVALARKFMDDLTALKEMALNTGRNNIIEWEMMDLNFGPADDEEGI